MIDLQERDFKYIPLAKSEIIGKPVTDNHYDEIIEHSSYVYLENSKPVVYLNLNYSGFDELIPHLQNLKFAQSTRKTLGQYNKSMLFGAVAAKINRDSFCNVGATVSHAPVLNQLLKLKYSTLSDAYMKLAIPQWQKVGQNVFKNSDIHEDWRMGNSFWTSGIINKNSPHNFHMDDNNCRNAHSAMITLKNNVSGGYLVMPEYRIAFKVSNRSLIYFCGREIIHGVSPMQIHQDGFRYSIVYYTTADLKYCDSYENEMSKANF